MTSAAHGVHYSYDEYLAIERMSNVKHEYLDGQIYAMGGGTLLHASLAMTMGALLSPQLRAGRCRAYTSDLRVHVKQTGLETYPDLTVVCGRAEPSPKTDHAIVNPTVIVEVLSKSTAEWDAGGKFEHYQQIPSLKHYVLVSQDERRVAVWTRSDDGWSSRVAGDGEIAELPAIGARIDVRELYTAAAQPE